MEAVAEFVVCLALILLGPALALATPITLAHLYKNPFSLPLHQWVDLRTLVRGFSRLLALWAPLYLILILAVDHPALLLLEWVRAKLGVFGDRIVPAYDGAFFESAIKEAAGQALLLCACVYSVQRLKPREETSPKWRPVLRIASLIYSASQREFDNRLWWVQTECVYKAANCAASGAIDLLWDPEAVIAEYKAMGQGLSEREEAHLRREGFAPNRVRHLAAVRTWKSVHSSLYEAYRNGENQFRWAVMRLRTALRSLEQPSAELAQWMYQSTNEHDPDGSVRQSFPKSIQVVACIQSTKKATTAHVPKPFWMAVAGVAAGTPPEEDLVAHN